jgi:hypothetical protein
MLAPLSDGAQPARLVLIPTFRSLDFAAGGLRHTPSFNQDDGLRLNLMLTRHCLLDGLNQRVWILYLLA